MRKNKVVEISIEKLEKFNNMKISIVTAAYNSGKTIRDTLESVLRQTYDNYELIIKDGGSKDNTLDICRDYEQRFNGRMKIISAPDKGIYDAMNQGISSASGDIVGILNSDDFYTSDDILITVADTFAKEYTIDALYGDVHYVDSQDTNKIVRFYSSRLFRRSWMRFGFMPAHPSFYCRKETYDRYMIKGCYFNTSYKIAADFENLLRMIFVHKIKTIYIKKDFVTMRTGGASSSGITSHKQINKDHLRALKENGINSNYFFLSIRYLYKILELIYSKIMTGIL